MEQDAHSDDEIKQILSYKNVAVVGMSKYSEKAAHFVPKYLIENGFNVIPVNPNASEILDRKCHSSLTEVDVSIDIVDVFRPSDQVLPIIQEAIKKKPKVIWLQQGIHNTEAPSLQDGAFTGGTGVRRGPSGRAPEPRLCRQREEEGGVEFREDEEAVPLLLRYLRAAVLR